MFGAGVGGMVIVAVTVVLIGSGCGAEAVGEASSKAAEVAAESSLAKELALQASREASLGEASAFGTATKAFDDSNAAFEGAQRSGDPAELKAAETADAYALSAEVETSAAEADQAESQAVVSTVGDAVCSVAELELSNQSPPTAQQWADGLLTDVRNRLGYSVPAAVVEVALLKVQAKLDEVITELNSVIRADPSHWRWWVQQLQAYWQCG